MATMKTLRHLLILYQQTLLEMKRGDRSMLLAQQVVTMSSGNHVACFGSKTIKFIIFRAKQPVI